MICPKCGCEITGNYCSNCGMPYMTEDETAVTLEPRDMATEDKYPEYAETLHRMPDKEPARPRVSRKRAESSSRAPSSSKAQSSKKEMKKKDVRLKKLESELDQLKSHAEESRKNLDQIKAGRRDQHEAEPSLARDTDRNRSRNHTSERSADQSNHTQDTYQAVKSVGIGAVVLGSRLMQLVSALLMAAMTVVMLRSFWEHGQVLGDIRYVAAERNYGLALYAGFAGISLFMGLIWCLWILSRKGAGGGIRMKKYDTGRGFLPFLFCMAVIVAVGILQLKVPYDQEMWRGAMRGLRTAIDAVYAHRNGLFFCSGLGAVLSFVRKLLRV